MGAFGPPAFGRPSGEALRGGPDGADRYESDGKKSILDNKRKIQRMFFLIKVIIKHIIEKWDVMWRKKKIRLVLVVFVTCQVENQ